MKMISIGLIVENGFNYINAINSITNQTYDSIEIIVSMNEGINISAYDVLECIRVTRKSNLKRVIINCEKKQKAFEEHMDDIIKSAQGDGLIFMTSNDYIWGEDAIERLIKECELTNKKIILGQTVVLGKSMLIGNSSRLTKSKEPYSTMAEMIRGGSFFFVARDWISKKDRKNISWNEIEILDKAFICHLINIKKNKRKFKCLIRNKGERSTLNYTGALYLQEFLDKIINKKIDRTRINQEIDTLEHFVKRKAENGYWSITDSDFKLLHYLSKIKRIVKYNLLKEHLLKNILEEIQNISEKKIKILLLTQEYFLWPSLKSVYDEALKDERYIVNLVYIPFSHPEKKISPEKEFDLYKKEGYEITEYSKYDVSFNSPDVVIYIKPYDNIPKEFLFNNIDKVVRRGVYIRYAPISNIRVDDRLIELFFSLPAYYLMWKCLAYTKEEVERASKYAMQHGKEWIEIGHPRNDFTFEDLSSSDREYFEKLKRLAKGRKIFFWNTSAPIEEEGQDTSYSSFLKWGEQIIDLFEKNSKVFVIWRPHPRFFAVLKKRWSESKYNELIERVEKIENIYIDEYEQYTPTMYVSDALISDLSSLVDLYVPLMHPILLTTRTSNELKYYNREFLDSVYIMNSIKDVSDFIEIVEEEKKEKYEKIQKYVFENFLSSKTDKKVAQLLLDEIEKGIIEEERVLFIDRPSKVGEIIY